MSSASGFTKVMALPVFFTLLAVWLTVLNVAPAFAGGLDAALCSKVDVVSGKFTKAESLVAGAPGFTLAVTSKYQGRVLVNLVWQDIGARKLAEDMLVLGQGQTKFASFKAPGGALTLDSYSMVLSVAGQPDQVLAFEVKPAQTATQISDQENVSQALARVFKTKEGPEAAKAGAEVIGIFFDKELNSKSGSKKQATTPAAQATKARKPAPVQPAAKSATTTPSAAAQQAHPATSGGIQAICARRVAADKAPVETPKAFRTSDTKIYLALQSMDPGLKDLVRVSWFTDQVEGMPPDRKLSSDRTILRVGAWNTAVFMPPEGGFWPGSYRVEVEKDGRRLAQLRFNIESEHKTAQLMDQAGPQTGVNLAQAGLGGKVVSATSQANSTSWSKDGLIDGYGYGGEDCKPSCGWASSGRKFPQELVFAFNQERQAQIKGLVLDAESCSGDGKCLQSLPRLVEVWASNQAPDAGYTLAATRRLRPIAARYYIPLAGLQAKYLKLVIRSHYGSSRRTQLAEVEIIEQPGPSSIVADVPIDLALPALGGTVLRYTSQSYRGEAVRLLSKHTDGKGWRSADAKLPQEFTFCLRDDSQALIERLELNMASSADPASRPREVAVLLSSDSPTSGFSETARVQIPANAPNLTIPLGRKARFIKLRILENHGGKYTSLGKVGIIEGKAQGYSSLLLRPVRPLSSAAGTAPQPDPALITSKVQPGLTPQAAPTLELGGRIKAQFSNYDQRHYYTLELKGDRPGMLNLELMGLPFLRTKFTLKDMQGQQVVSYSPRRTSRPTTVVSWRVKPGKYLLEAQTTPANIVLAWDMSRSMAPHIDLLQKAVKRFLEKVQPSEKIALVAFNNNLHFLSDFTNDRAKLLAAVSGKFKAEMATRLYDAVEKGIALLSQSTGAGALVVMTDGVDMGSSMKTPEFWQMLDTNPVSIFTIGLGGELKVKDPAAGISGGHLLRHMAQAGGGRFIFIPSADQLVNVYKQVARELMSGTAYYLKPTWSDKPGSLLVKTMGQRIVQMAAPPRIELVLDASGSMKKKLGGRTRMAISKDVISELVQGLPEDVEVALRVYGHRIREGRKGDCQDTELVYPFSRVNKKTLIRKVRSIKALGTTPTAYALLQTAGDFGDTQGEKTVILVTDGKEECGGDMVQVLEELRGKGLNVRLHVVGFAVKDPEAVQQMQRAAKAGKGRYISAADRPALKKAISQTLAIPYTVRDSSGREIARGSAGTELSLAAGYYQVALDTPQGELLQREVQVDADRLTQVRVTKDGPKIGVQVLAPGQRP